MSDISTKRIEELLETLVKIHLSPIIDKELADLKMKQLYEMTGRENISVISKRLGFSTGKISQIWQRWEQKGLLNKQGKFYKKAIL